MRYPWIIIFFLLLSFTCSLFAHRDRRLELNNGNLVGLPPEFLPATLDLANGKLSIAGNHLEFSEFLKDILADPTRYNLAISSSWYHESEVLPPYVSIKVTPKGKDFTYSVLIDMKNMKILQVQLELIESDTVTRLVPIDPTYWKDGQGGGTITVIE